MSTGATFAVTLERGVDGTYLAWVNELPGCAVRAASKDEVLAQLPDAIRNFLAWSGADDVPTPQITVAEEVESAIEADEDTEVLVATDREPLTEEAWRPTEAGLARSRAELVALLDRVPADQLGERRAGSERTVREELEHVAFVELMYAAWTFDLQSREGLAEFLAWTREVASARLEALAHEGAADLTWADWGGAPRLEPWTARKAARRLLWHELLHLRALQVELAR